MNEERAIIRLFETEKGFEKHGDVTMVISGFCGGVYSWEDAFEEIKRAYKRGVHSSISKKENDKSEV